MPLPAHVLDPPFNIVRCAYVVLGVRDVAASVSFYSETIGLSVEDANGDFAYLRGMEELQHHSLVLVQSGEPVCRAMGFKLASESDLDRAAAYFAGEHVEHAFVARAHQGRTLAVTDRFGLRFEYYFAMERRPRILQKYGLYKGVRPQRIEHFNAFVPELQSTMEAYAALGFRLTEYSEEEPADGGRIAAAWMQRKGNVHDLALTNGDGPRLHHFAYFVPTPLDIIHLCDVMATSGHIAQLERGPGRHGISNAFFLYARDPDGHRLELYCSDYQTMDPDHPPLRWSLRDPQRQTLWGAPAPRSWFEEGSPFDGVETRKAAFRANVIIAH